jgi:hypothetical protein
MASTDAVATTPRAGGVPILRRRGDARLRVVDERAERAPR